MIQQRKFKNSTFLLLALSSMVAFSDNAYAHELTHEKTKSSKQSVHIREVIKEAQAAKVDGVPMNSTYASSYIGKRAIKLASPVTSPQELLNRRPGIVATAGGPLGVRQHIRFRGFSDGAFTEEFDGIPLNNAFTGYSVSRANRIPITINNISGVKIYDGVNNPSVSGPQSLAGTINYLPKNRPSIFMHQVASAMVVSIRFSGMLRSIPDPCMACNRTYPTIVRHRMDGWPIRRPKTVITIMRA